jgi:DNA helicase II / ATP-dependent DNA helicase PcrA
MDILGALNPQQLIAVQHGPGPALVLAGAGSGKTRVIVHRIAYLIHNRAARPEQILAVTFTNKAAAEMRGRIQTMLGPNRTSEPLLATFHSFCVRVLRRDIGHLGYKRDFSIYDTDDQKRVLKQLLQELGLTEKQLAPREVMSRISFAKNHRVPSEQYASRFPDEDAETIAAIYAAYEKRLRQANALDFDDLLVKTVELLESTPAVRDFYGDWYRYILVDEYQDTNRPQYDLLRLLTTRHNNLFVVGDEDQSIYGFRGADIQNILRFEQDFPGAKVIKLEQNYRSTQNILRTAGAVVEQNVERKGKTLWTENSGGDVVTCRLSRSARSEAAWVADRIVDTLSRTPQQRIAVLYRTNFLSRNFEDVLNERGIIYNLVGSVAFFSRMEVKDLLAYLRVLYNPEDDVSLRRIINTPPRGIGDKTIDLLARRALEKGVPLIEAMREAVRDGTLPGRASASLCQFQNMVDRWAGVRDTLPIGRLLEAIVSDTHYRDMLQKGESHQEAEDRTSNVEELTRAASESEGRGETVFEFLDRAALSSELDHLDPNAQVVLMTLHSAKGLEFDVVFLAGLEEGLFPHNLSLGSRREVEEERRLCYVGITRARRKLYVTWTPFRRTFGSDFAVAAKRSRFLDEMPTQLLELSEERGLHASERNVGLRRRWEDHRIYERDNDYQEDEHEEELDREDGPAPSDNNHPRSLADVKAYLARQQQGTTPKPAGKVIKAGVRVRHSQFGEGIVVSREKVGVDTKLVIEFSRVGRKTLIEKYAKLEAL